MKTKSIVLSILLLALTIGVAQNATNPTRKVMYTLPPHTVIYDDAFNMRATQPGHTYVAITFDTLNNEYTLLLDGKVLAKTNIEKPYPFQICSICAIEENDYVFAYAKKENGKVVYYVNNKGVEQGPFEDFSYNYKDISLKKDNDTIIKTYYSHAPFSAQSNAFSYKEKGKWYLNINGKIIGPNPSKADVHKITREGYYIFSYQESPEKSFININGETFGPYQYIDYYALGTPINKSYAFLFQEGNKKQSININGKVFGHYEKISFWFEEFSNSNKYIFSYSEKGKEYVNVNETILGPYQRVFPSSLDIDEESYAFSYVENGKTYVNANGNILGPYQNIEDLNINKEWGYKFHYKEGNTTYVNINGTIFGPYQTAHIKWWGEGEFYIKYVDIKDGKQYENTNGEIELAPEEDMRDIVFQEIRTADGKTRYMKINRDDKTAVLQGKYTVKSRNVPWYDDYSDSFVWITIEGREFVMYEYSLE